MPFWSEPGAHTNFSHRALRSKLRLRAISAYKRNVSKQRLLRGCGAALVGGLNNGYGEPPGRPHNRN